MNIRRCQVSDLIAIQNCNLINLPENYQLKYHIYHIISWPQCSWIAVDDDGKVAGYVLAKIEEDDTSSTIKPHGHITSLAVMRPYRRQGLAKKLMHQCERSMFEIYGATKITLHVRKSNVGARSLYESTLGFITTGTDEKYYGDGEDAFAMCKEINQVESLALYL